VRKTSSELVIVASLFFVQITSSQSGVGGTAWLVRHSPQEETEKVIESGMKCEIKTSNFDICLLILEKQNTVTTTSFHFIFITAHG